MTTGVPNVQAASQQQQPSTSGEAPYVSLGGSGGSAAPGLTNDQRLDPHAGLMASLGAALCPLRGLMTETSDLAS